MYCLDNGVVEEIVEYVREDNARLVRTYLSPDTSFEHGVSLSDNRFTRPTAEDIEQAERNFDKEYRGLRIWLLRGLYVSRSEIPSCFLLGLYFNKLIFIHLTILSFDNCAPNTTQWLARRRSTPSLSA